MMARLGPSDAHHLLGADRAGLRAVRYPILPKITRVESEAAREEILEIRHSSLYAPRDFDISPYFEVVKPTLATASTTGRCNGPDQPLRSRSTGSR